MPIVGLLRVEQVILVVPTTKVNQLSDIAAGNNLAGQLGGGIANVVKAHQGFDARLFSRDDHLVGVCRAKRQRFFGVNMLTSGNGSQCHLFMQEIRRADIHHIYDTVGHQSAPVIGGAGKSPSSRSALRGGKINIRQQFANGFGG